MVERLRIAADVLAEKKADYDGPGALATGSSDGLAPRAYR